MTSLDSLRRRVQRNCNFHPEVAKLAVAETLRGIQDILLETGSMRLQHFGEFRVVTKPGRWGQSFAGPGIHLSGKRVKGPPRTVVEFRALGDLAETVELQGATTARRDDDSRTTNPPAG